MAINYGKGLRGALGRMKAVESQYVGLPYKEMLQGNLMRQAAYDKGEEALNNLSTLYNQNLLDQDAQVIQAKEDQFNTELGEKMESVGGDLGKLTGFLSGKLRGISNDPTYTQAIQNKKDAATYFSNVDKAKIDPEMKSYLKNKSMSGYSGADKGGFAGTPFMEITKADFSKDLQRVAKQLYDTAPEVESEQEVLVGPDGVVVPRQYWSNYTEGAGFKPGYRLDRQQVKTKKRTPQEVKDYLDSYIDQNYSTYLGAIADQRGADYDTAKRMLTIPTANNYSRFEQELGNIYKVAETSSDTATPTTPASSYVSAGVGINIPGKSTLEGALSQTDKTPESIRTYLDVLANNNQLPNSTYYKSLVEKFELDSGLASIDSDKQEALDQLIGNSPLRKYFEQEDGTIRTVIPKTERFSAAVPQEDRQAVSALSQQLSSIEKDFNEKKSDAQEKFEEYITEGIAAPQITAIPIKDKDSAAMNNLTSTLLDTSGLAYKVFEATGTDDKVVSYEEVEIDDIKTLESPAITEFAKYPQTEDDGTFRTLTVTGKEANGDLKTYKVKVPEEQFKTLFGRGDFNLYDAAGVTGDTEGAGEYQNLNRIANVPGAVTELPTVEAKLRNHAGVVLANPNASPKVLEYDLDNIEIDATARKNKNGQFEVVINLSMSKIEDSNSKVNTEYIGTFRNREEARDALDKVSSATGLLEELFQDAKKLK
jgi:hypothetical protein